MCLICQDSTHDEKPNTDYDYFHRSSLRVLALGLLTHSLYGGWIIARCNKNYFLGFKRWVTLASEPLSAHGGSCDILVIRSVDAGRTA